ncbi:MAG: STAS domain-containing protein [Actinomycetota bacterium]|nr:STAS domain-containing protein [Actinomycetota bacterium]
MSTAAGPGKLQVGYRLSSGVAVVDVSGEVDIGNCGLLRDGLLQAVADQGRNSMVVNLAAVSFIDSTGIGVFVGVWHRIQAGQGIMALAELSPRAQAVFSVAGLTKMLSIYPTEAQAVQACRELAGATPGQGTGTPH